MTPIQVEFGLGLAFRTLKAGDRDTIFFWYSSEDFSGEADCHLRSRARFAAQLSEPYRKKNSRTQGGQTN
jgi:hypothetical protein